MEVNWHRIVEPGETIPSTENFYCYFDFFFSAGLLLDNLTQLPMQLDLLALGTGKATNEHR